MSKSPIELLSSDPVELSLLSTKMKLMIIASEIIRENGWTQKEASLKLGVSQPRISNLMNSKVSKFSIDTAFEILGKLGYLSEMTFNPLNRERPVVMELKKTAV